MRHTFFICGLFLLGCQPTPNQFSEEHYRNFYTPPAKSYEPVDEHPAERLTTRPEWKQFAIRDGASAILQACRTPSTASLFPEEPFVYAFFDPDTGNSTLVLDGTIDAQNKYGAMVRSVFRVKWTTSGNPGMTGMASWVYDSSEIIGR